MPGSSIRSGQSADRPAPRRTGPPGCRAGGKRACRRGGGSVEWGSPTTSAEDPMALGADDRQAITDLISMHGHPGDRGASCSGIT
ncbi:hypothetical protein L083_4094 [Actinoplanes sp. N902-109]|nr:hypothetical protein L083_4094 [Actinoplanes sp. N902-109]